ncbi:MAG: hydroxypyruvate isomerase family protein [Planctomycetaceae bacterium]
MSPTHTDRPDLASHSRRDWLKSATAVAGALTLGQIATAADGPVASRGRIHQSLVHWCYENHFPGFDALCEAAVKLGCQSIELCDPQHWPTLKKHGLTCAISGSHGFKTGFNNPSEWEECRAKLRERIGQCAEHGVKRVITFTGFANGLSREEGGKNFVKGIAPIVKDAEQAGVTLCLEMLNTRDDTHPMKGHPGYQGNDTEYCIDLCKRLDSPNMKLLFDIYHVQIMNGDVIRRIHQHKDFLGHIHTAGNPGRGELDPTQEINYPAVMQALLDVGYDGYVGQEFIPTRDCWSGLSEAVKQCDV